MKLNNPTITLDTLQTREIRSAVIDYIGSYYPLLKDTIGQNYVNEIISWITSHWYISSDAVRDIIQWIEEIKNNRNENTKTWFLIACISKPDRTSNLSTNFLDKAQTIIPKNSLFVKDFAKKVEEDIWEYRDINILKTVYKCDNEAQIVDNRIIQADGIDTLCDSINRSLWVYDTQYTTKELPTGKGMSRRDFVKISALSALLASFWSNILSKKLQESLSSPHTIDDCTPSIEEIDQEMCHNSELKKEFDEHHNQGDLAERINKSTAYFISATFCKYIWQAAIEPDQFNNWARKISNRFLEKGKALDTRSATIMFSLALIRINLMSRAAKTYHNHEIQHKVDHEIKELTISFATLWFGLLPLATRTQWWQQININAIVQNIKLPSQSQERTQEDNVETPGDDVKIPEEIDTSNHEQIVKQHTLVSQNIYHNVCKTLSATFVIAPTLTTYSAANACQQFMEQHKEQILYMGRLSTLKNYPNISAQEFDSNVTKFHDDFQLNLIYLFKTLSANIQWLYLLGDPPNIFFMLSEVGSKINQWWLQNLLTDTGRGITQSLIGTIHGVHILHNQMWIWWNIADTAHDIMSGITQSLRQMGTEVWTKLSQWSNVGQAEKVIDQAIKELQNKKNSKNIDFDAQLITQLIELKNKLPHVSLGLRTYIKNLPGLMQEVCKTVYSDFQKWLHNTDWSEHTHPDSTDHLDSKWFTKWFEDIIQNMATRIWDYREQKESNPTSSDQTADPEWLNKIVEQLSAEFIPRIKRVEDANIGRHLEDQADDRRSNIAAHIQDMIQKQEKEMNTQDQHLHNWSPNDTKPWTHLTDSSSQPWTGSTQGQSDIFDRLSTHTSSYIKYHLEDNPQAYKNFINSITDTHLKSFFIIFNLYQKNIADQDRAEAQKHLDVLKTLFETIKEHHKLNLTIDFDTFCTLPPTKQFDILFSSVQLKKWKIRETQYFYWVSP
jgi:hypothetical protein